MTEYYKSSPRFYEDSSETKYDPFHEEGNSKDASGDYKHNSKEKILTDYIKQLLVEKSLIDETQCPYAYKHISEEINKAQQKVIKGPPRDNRYIDLYFEKPTKVSVKVLLPVKEFPRFNFVGKLLGPKGSTLKQLQEETKCFMNIYGRGSIRDPDKEEELRKSLEPKYAHLSDDLHVEISAIATPAVAHTRIASALKEIQKYLVPTYGAPDTDERVLPARRSIFGNVTLPEEEVDDDPRRYIPSGKRLPQSKHREAPRPASRSGISSNSSVMSILNKARIAMEESYSFQNRRRPAREPEYEDYADDNYHPKRYHAEKGPYGQNIHHDVIYKKRKI